LYRFVYYYIRDMRRWIRGRVTVLASLVTPLAWLVFVGLALPTRFTENYLEFLAPGILVMTMLFTTLQGGSSLIFDKILGFLHKFLALPPPREALLLGKIFFITTRGLLQSTVILLVAAVLGARPPLSSIPLIYFDLALFGIIFSTLAVDMALLVSDHDTYAALNSLMGMPLFFTSTALMPRSYMPGWLAFISTLNPVNYAVESIRLLFRGGGVDSQGVIVLMVSSVVLVLVSTRLFRRLTV